MGSCAKLHKSKKMTKETREIKGEVEGWSNEPRDFHSNNMGSRGVKIENEWHNVINKLPELEKLDKDFPKGSFIKFTEEKNVRGYWDVKGDIEKVEKDKAYPKDMKEFPSKYTAEFSAEKNKDILFQVAFKGSVKLMNQFFGKPKESVIDIDDLCKWTLNTTEKLYKGMKEKKLKLQEKGEW